MQWNNSFMSVFCFPVTFENDLLNGHKDATASSELMGIVLIHTRLFDDSNWLTTKQTLMSIFWGEFLCSLISDEWKSIRFVLLPRDLKDLPQNQEQNLWTSWMYWENSRLEIYLHGFCLNKMHFWWIFTSKISW